MGGPVWSVGGLFFLLLIRIRMWIVSVIAILLLMALIHAYI